MSAQLPHPRTKPLETLCILFHQNIQASQEGCSLTLGPEDGCRDSALSSNRVTESVAVLLSAQGSRENRPCGRQRCSQASSGVIPVILAAAGLLSPRASGSDLAPSTRCCRSSSASFYPGLWAPEDQDVLCVGIFGTCFMGINRCPLCDQNQGRISQHSFRLEL